MPQGPVRSVWVVAVQCDRCHGLLLREWIVRDVSWWWRCSACGERIDGTILRHRAEQSAVEAWVRDGTDRETREWAALFARLAAVTTAPRSLLG